VRRTTLAIFLAVAIGAFCGAYAQDEPGHDWDGSRATPVHRLPVLDEENEQILPTYRDPMPISMRNTCGPCHNYETVSSGLHFNASQPDGQAGRPGEPWVWLDEKLGTQLPLSYRGWTGTWNPDDIGLTPWRFTQLFGRHLPGGDVAEPADILADPKSRWDVSGVVEVNCMGCHNAAPDQDPSEWAKQIARENFRWAVTAASGLGEVGGMASRLPDMWNVHSGPNPDDSEFAVPPSVTYTPAHFDDKGRAVFDISYKPLDKNCLQCHSVSPVEKKRWELDADVHTAAGMDCADCHRNGLDHQMVRGYESEAAERKDPSVAEFSCKGCHLGFPELEDQSLMAAMGGRLGAPRPAHKDIPAVHFDKMSCTSCHSGPWPEDLPQMVRTSRANRLGIHGVAQWYTDEPRIGEPVFMKAQDGKLTPYRMMWPAFWGRLDGETVTPVLPDDVAAAATGILDAPQQIGAMLVSMSTGLAAYAEIYPEDPPAQAVFLTPGIVYHVNVDGGLDVAPYNGALIVPPEGLWAREQDNQFEPLVNDFDPNDEQLVLQEEEAIFKVVDAIVTTVEWLAPYADPRGEPVATKGNKIFRRSADGYFEMTERSDGTTTDTFAWGWLKDDEIAPLVPEFVVRAIADTEGVAESINEEQTARMITALSEGAQAQGGKSTEFVYVSSGKLFRLDASGAIVASDHKSAEPYAWALGHNVRPASQSLGARACTDCHAEDAPFYFGTIEPKGPLKIAAASVIPVRDLHGEDDPIYIYTSQFFKWLIIVTMVLLLIHIAGDLARRALNKRAGRA